MAGLENEAVSPRSPVTTARLAWRAALVALSLSVFSWTPRLFGSYGTTPNAPFLPGTVLLLAIGILAVTTWQPGARPEKAREGHLPRPAWHRWVSIAAAAVLLAVGGMLLFSTARDWLGVVLTTTLDPYRGDMLPGIRVALTDLMRGRDPYGTHYVPWPMPLAYGPVLWAPYLLPFLLQADLRFVSVFGALFVPAACLVAGLVLAMRGSWPRGAILAALAWVVLRNPDVGTFTGVAHTPSYWPLLVLFAVLVASRWWVAASVVLGLLVVGRSTMVSIVPVLLIGVWHQQRPSFLKAILAVAATVTVAYAPFAVWDFDVLRYNVLDSYFKVVKEAVWASPDHGAERTFGLTGVLLAHGLSAWVEVCQAIVLALVYAAAWRPLRRGASVLPWAGLALLAFSMTTLWPVYYIYFDVFLLFAAAVVAEERITDLFGSRWRITRFMAAVTAVVVIAGVTATLAAHPDYYAINIGDSRPRWRLSGFGPPETEGATRYSWVIGERAAVLLGRTTRRAAVLRVECRPYLPSPSSVQTLQPVVNGIRLAKVPIPAGWTDLHVEVPSRAWFIGLNRVDLYFGYAAPLDRGGPSERTEAVAAAVARVAIEPLR